MSVIVTAFLSSLVINIFLKKFGLPTIIGYIVTGTLVSHIFQLNEIMNSHELKEIAEFGIVFLMFTIGLEFSIAHLKKMRYEVFVAGTLQVLITAIVFYLISFFVFDLNQTVSIVVGASVSLSSTAIVLKTFNDTGEIYKRYGQRTLGILIFQDIAVIPILLLLGFLSSEGDSIALILGKTVLDGVILVLIMFVIGKYFLNYFFTAITKTNSEELFVGFILFLAIGSSYLAHELGFSYSLGAFIAGMMIAETNFKYQAEADLIPFRDLLLGVFFITVGMQINFSIIFDNISYILLLLIFIMTIKFIIIFLIVKLRENIKISFKTALSLIQVGEFSLAILEIAKTNNLIENVFSQILIVTVVISMILTPFILKNLVSIANLFLREKENSLENETVTYDDLKNHIIIIGYGEFGENIAKTLKKINYPYCVIENNLEIYQKGLELKEPIIFGNALKKQILHNASIEKTSKIIIAINEVDKIKQLYEHIKYFVKNDQIIIKVHTIEEKNILKSLNIRHIIVENTESSNAVKKLIFA
jgi:CPA2 family monovalent cation:H+ antiporter-2